MKYFLKKCCLGLTGVSASAQLAQLGTVSARNGPLEKDDEFDMFAQSRNATYENTKKGYVRLKQILQ